MTTKDFLFSKEYNSLYYRVQKFFKYKIPFISQGWYEYHFPYQHWWNVRKIFKRPRIHFLFRKKKMWFFGLPICDKYYNKVVDIRMSALGYKWKYGSPRHEWDPYVSILLFNKFHFLWIFNWIDSSDEDSGTASMATWEAILDYLNNSVPLDKLVKYHTWRSGIGENEHNITIKNNMK